MAKRRRKNGGPKAIAPTPLAKVGVRAAICKMEREGLTYKQIGAALGISAPAVCYHVKRMKEEWQRSIDEDRTMMVYEKNLELEDVKYRMVQDYELSKVGVDAEGDEVVKPGDPSYMRVYLDAVKAQRELKGLDAPTKIDQRQATVNVTVPGGLPLTDKGGVDWDALAGRPPVEDPVDAAVRERLSGAGGAGAEQKALPVHVNGAAANGKPRGEQR